jgi:hypothetical protein
MYMSKSMQSALATIKKVLNCFHFFFIISLQKWNLAITFIGDFVKLWKFLKFWYTDSFHSFIFLFVCFRMVETVLTNKLTVIPLKAIHPTFYVGVSLYDIADYTQYWKQVMKLRSVEDATLKHGFPGGHPSKHWLHLTLLNFTDRMMFIMMIIILV